ncbi:hypothetical protein [Roseomonas genomospecies 6]|uniref:Uncharacterized protein n=1 Tax=Roseomonas genomospecies 6 TaxID=214106 RepID=A0A9W7NI93_9PROT|nr:hypothetical protein [Roseomonas genomospecies 6]KAA0679435.1 hypothetical protein DS843_15945 [Roseomonas genomospecies 6]
MTRLYDLVGQTFGRLTVLERSRNEKGLSTWRCQCSCGRITEVETARLRSQYTRSCGCLKADPTEFKRPVGRPPLYNIDNYIGQEFGFWTVIGFSHRDERSRNQHWVCRCRCGAEKPVNSTNLLRGISTKCADCADIESRGAQNAQWKGSAHVPGTYVTSLRHSARERGIEFTITVDDLEAQWVAQEGRCAYTGELLGFPEVMNARGMIRTDFTASVDRRDSAVGYVPGNIQWVHKVVNIMKMDLPETVFIEFCVKVAKGARAANA